MNFRCKSRKNVCFLTKQNSKRETMSTERKEPMQVNAKKVLSTDDFIIGRKLAGGSLSTVYVAQVCGHDGFLVALKVLNKSQLIRKNMQDQLKREIDIQASLKHKHILRLYDYFFDQERVFLVLEYAPKGELYALLQIVGHFSDKISSRIIKQVISALEYCHSLNIIHRDIKPENLLLNAAGQILLSDFGWSVRSLSQRRTRCGTIDYLAPEIVSAQEYDHRVDLWCLGVLTYELLTGNAPFYAPNRKTVRQMIKQATYKLPETLSPFAKTFIQCLLVVKPENRMSLSDAKKHSWIVLYDQSDDI